MDFDLTIKNIRSISLAINGKAGEVMVIYRGTDFGSLPWLVRMDNREADAPTHTEALSKLTIMLRTELEKKVSFAEIEARRLRSEYNQLVVS